MNFSVDLTCIAQSVHYFLLFYPGGFIFSGKLRLWSQKRLYFLAQRSGVPDRARCQRVSVAIFMLPSNTALQFATMYTGWPVNLRPVPVQLPAPHLSLCGLWAYMLWLNSYIFMDVSMWSQYWHLGPEYKTLHANFRGYICNVTNGRQWTD